MLRALNLCQDVGNNHLSTDSVYDNHSCIIFPFHCTLNQVDLSTNFPDKVILTKVVIQPIEKLKSVGPHKLIPKKNMNKKKSRLENKKFRSMSKLLYGVYLDPSSDEGNIQHQRLLYTNEDKKNYSLMDTSESVPIVT